MGDSKRQGLSRNTEDPARLRQRLRHREVVLRGGTVTGGMVVGDDDGVGATDEGGLAGFIAQQKIAAVK